MSMAGARDTNGNQTVDTSDSFGFAGEIDSTGYFMSGCGIRFSEKDNNGDVKITINNERAMDVSEKFIEYMNKRDLTMLAQYYVSENSDPHGGIFMPKLMNNELMFYSQQLLVSLNLREMNSDFGILPLPKYDKAQENYISVANTWFSDHLVIPATNDNLEMTGNVIEAMGYGAQHYITPAFIDNTVLSKAVRDDDSADMVRLILDTQIFDLAYMFNWGSVRTVFSVMCNNNQTNFASQYAAIEGNVQSALAKTLEEMK
ncbi:MAG: hypothetical protein HFE63_07880 [Clostridiales bacterium]|nr:hypothetical protein [Clostridiales bacterium]